MKIESLMLKTRAGLHEKNQGSITPLVQAAQSDKKGVISTLIEMTVEDQDRFSKALYRDDLNAIPLITKENINKKNIKGYTFLMLAASGIFDDFGHYKEPLAIVEFLIETKADVNEKSEKANTALAEAAFFCCTNIVICLLKAKAAVNESEKQHGLTPLMKAAARMKMAEINEREAAKTVSTLVEHGAEVDLQDHYGRTALMLACEGLNPATMELKVVERLLEADCDVSLMDKDGKFAYDYLKTKKDIFKEFKIKRNATITTELDQVSGRNAEDSLVKPIQTLIIGYLNPYSFVQNSKGKKRGAAELYNENEKREAELTVGCRQS
jgi:ankyrin repeat protein